jgi:hypothetical protein
VYQDAAFEELYSLHSFSNEGSDLRGVAIGIRFLISFGLAMVEDRRQSIQYE